MGRFQLRPEMEQEADKYSIHPAVMDAGYINSLFAVSFEHLGSDLWVPLFIESISVFGDAPHSGYCYTKLKNKTSELFVTDNYFYDENGSLVLIVEGLSGKRIRSLEAFGINNASKPAEVQEKIPETTIKQSAAERSIVSPSAPADSSSVQQQIEIYIQTEIKKLTENPSSGISLDTNFMELGIDSSNLIMVTSQIEHDIGIEVYPTLFFEYQTIRELARHFYDEHEASFAKYLHIDEPTQSPGDIQEATVLAEQDSFHGQQVSPVNNAATVSPPDQLGCSVSPNPTVHPDGSHGEIAIIGMAGKVAESDTFDQFWENLKQGRDLIREIPANHWDYRPWFSEDRDEPNKTYSKWGTFIEQVDKFDPQFFGITAREATWMDPQLRILLEVVHETIEDAGYGQKIAGSNTGVYVGSCFHEYWDEVVRARTPFTDYEHGSSAASTLSGRISYTFDLQGASLPIDNACASTLTAIHLACMAMRNGEIEKALVCGSNLLLSPLHYVYFARMQALSPTGRCYPFDKAADGYVPGEGVAAVLLKPLDQALADNDQIHAIIKGSAINHVGRSNNPAAPRPELQTKVLINAWQNAGIDPETLTYIEAQGNGSIIGDPIEIGAVNKAFKFFNKKTPCAIGSTKAHIGYLEGASGIVGLIKTILAMKNQQIPAMPNFKALNPYIKLKDSPLYINTEWEEWNTAPGTPRRAGVSAFGMVGNNAHVVIEEFISRGELPESSLSTTPSHLLPNVFVLSAKNKKRLKKYAQNFLDFLDDTVDEEKANRPLPDFTDMIYTLQVGREAMEERFATIVLSTAELREKLKHYLQGENDIEDFYQSGHDAESIVLEDALKAKDAIKLAQLWVQGAEIDWRSLYLSHRPKIVSLPTYPFARERYWIPEAEPVQGADDRSALSLNENELVST